MAKIRKIDVAVKELRQCGCGHDPERHSEDEQPTRANGVSGKPCLVGGCWCTQFSPKVVTE